MAYLVCPDSLICFNTAVTPKESIPEKAFPITRAEYVEFFCNAAPDGKERGIEQNRMVWVDRPPFTLPEIYDVSLTEINQWADEQLEPIRSQYPQSEIEGWPQQIIEAYTLRNDPDAPALNLRRIAQERGIELMALVAKVEKKAEIYSNLYGPVIGRRQRAEDQLDLIVKDSVLTDDQKRKQMPQVVIALQSESFS